MTPETPRYTIKVTLAWLVANLAMAIKATVVPFWPLLLSGLTFSLWMKREGGKKCI